LALSSISMSPKKSVGADDDSRLNQYDMVAGLPRGTGRSRVAQGRRQARILALETLYETDLAHHHPSEVLQRRSAVLQPDAEVADYARELLAGILRHRRELDDIIQARASAWPVAQMSPVDRNVLRLGLYESLYKRDTVPLKAAINEAVELAKVYGGDNTARLVNGVLGREVGSIPVEGEE
jgi:N utilization substance protein B